MKFAFSVVMNKDILVGFSKFTRQGGGKRLLRNGKGRFTQLHSIDTLSIRAA